MAGEGFPVEETAVSNPQRSAFHLAKLVTLGDAAAERVREEWGKDEIGVLRKLEVPQEMHKWGNVPDAQHQGLVQKQLRSCRCPTLEVLSPRH